MMNPDITVLLDVFFQCLALLCVKPDKMCQ